MITLHLAKSFMFRHIKPMLLVTLAMAIGAYYLVAPPAARGLSSTVVISQVYGGGGNSTAPLQNDFIELFNRGGGPVSLNGWSVQYASSTGSTWQKTDLTNVTLQPGQYYLIREAAGTGCASNPCGASLPVPDAIGSIAMSATAGKVVLLNTAALIGSGTVCPAGPEVVDVVGYGAGTNCVENAPAVTLSNASAALRNSNGCAETDNNGADFSVGTPAPRNTASAPGSCGSPLPALSINDVSVIEGNSGTVTATFTVSLSAPAPAGGISFDIATADNTATVADNDYVAKSLTGQTIAAGATTYSFIVTVNADANTEPNETFFVNVTNVAGATVADAQGVGTINTDDVPPTLIHDIQGAGETPNFAGQVVIVRGVVVGDFQGAANLNGFFVEEEQSDWDADPNTSEGIFVFAPSAPDVKVGDNVSVTGTVLNFNGATGLTELTTVTNVTINSSGNPLPPVQTVTLPVPASLAADLEKYEGMLVSFGALVVTDNESLGQFGELGLSSVRLFTPTNSIDPNDNPAGGNTTSGNSNVAAVTAAQSLNNRNQIVLNDGKTGSYPNPIPFVGAGAGATLRLGDSVGNLTGVLSFGFGSYRVEPTAAVNITAANVRPAAPDAVGGSLKVASANLENWFFTLGTGRGATNAAERNRQRDKLAAMLAGLNADVIGLIEIEKGTAAVPDAAVNELIAKLNTLGAGTYAVVPTPAAVYDATNPVGTDTDIKSGIIYRTGTVTAAGASLTDTAAAPGTYSRAPIVQTFQSKANGAKFTVVVNHLRSKSCGSGSGEDADQSTGQGCFNARRRSQAQALVSFVNTALVPADPDVLVVGDLNAYTQEDPIDVLRAAGFSDMLNANQYSFTFQSQVGRLDHAFATASFASQIAGGTVWHINADEPDVFDYNTESKTDDRYAATPFRSADHDPVLIGLNLACPAVTLDPATLPAGTAGAVYNQTVSAAGGVSSYSFSVTSGGLPEGLSLSSSGSISGTPAKTGRFDFTIAATGGGCTGSRDYSLTIACPAITVSPAAIPGGFRGMAYSVTFGAAGAIGDVTFSFTGPRPQGLNFNAATRTLSGTPLQSGNFAFTITAADSNGCTATRDYALAVNSTSLKLTDPVICLGPGGVVAVEAAVTNAGASPQPASFNAVLPASLLALSGSCTATTGACTVASSSTVAWEGALTAGQTVTIRYNAQIADGTPTGTQVCVTSNATVGGGAPGGVTACTTVNCVTAGPGNALPVTTPVSDQRPGSVLIYNIYTSAVDPNQQNTRFSITNTEPSRSGVVHLFFVDGSTCQVADSYLCLTANQTTTFLASDLDPSTAGYLIAVAVDQNGCPVNFNYLIGDEYVKFATGHAANLAAQSITAIAGGLPACNLNSTTATLAFDGVSYSPLPHALAASNLPSRADGNDTLLILNRIGGNLATGAATIGSVFGILHDDSETPVSFSLASGTCQLRGSLSATFPRTTPRYEQFVPAGRTAWMKMWISGGTAAMTGATINYNPNAANTGGAFNQGRNLHALTTTTSMSYTIPVFAPSC